MNKYQKEKSREIRDIMRTDRWRKMSYKEAKRKWRKGIRAFKVGDAWVVKDLAHMGFSRSRLMEVGAVYYKILKYAAERNLGFACYYEPYFDSYELRFNGWSVDGKKYTVCHAVTGDLIRQYRGPLSDIADRVLEHVNHKLREFMYPSVINHSLVYIPDDPHALKPIKDDKLIFDPTIERRADGSFRITEVSLIGRRP